MCGLLSEVGVSCLSQAVEYRKYNGISGPWQKGRVDGSNYISASGLVVSGLQLENKMHRCGIRSKAEELSFHGG